MERETKYKLSADEPVSKERIELIRNAIKSRDVSDLRGILRFPDLLLDRSGNKNDLG